MLNPLSASHSRHRLFFALFPPPLVARRIAHWAERYGPHAAFVRADRLHVTLDILDDFEAFPRIIAERLIEVGGSIAADPFMIELDQVSCGGGTIALRPRLKNQSLQRLVSHITAARAEADIAGREGYRFNPHMTLLYRESRPFSESVTPFAWQVTEFTLVHSLLGHTRHVSLGSWPLTGGNPDQYALL
jgi:RNA 2',3'-cyclic 3'-phosphodiesterase